MGPAKESAWKTVKLAAMSSSCHIVVLPLGDFHRKW
jgi:hypothetical protein